MQQSSSLNEVYCLDGKLPFQKINYDHKVEHVILVMHRNIGLSISMFLWIPILPFKFGTSYGLQQIIMTESHHNAVPLVECSIHSKPCYKNILQSRTQLKHT